MSEECKYKHIPIELCIDLECPNDVCFKIGKEIERQVSVALTRQRAEFCKEIAELKERGCRIWTAEGPVHGCKTFDGGMNALLSKYKEAQ